MIFVALYVAAIISGTLALLTLLELFAPNVGERVLPDVSQLDEWDRRKP